MSISICGGGSPLEAPPATTDTCEPHTPKPVGVLDWGEWAEEMSKTHDQTACPGCGLFLIWRPKETH
ncbi:hypothetical protein [Actinomadura luteofluorescens]|uniref:hypothetical protein n=1 Tax=Actinomadura luteofluorescens TaxID=46163 RepID=UPI003D933F36